MPASSAAVRDMGDPIGIRLGSDWDPIGTRLGSDWDPIGTSMSGQKHPVSSIPNVLYLAGSRSFGIPMASIANATSAPIQPPLPSTPRWPHAFLIHMIPSSRPRGICSIGLMGSRLGRRAHHSTPLPTSRAPRPPTLPAPLAPPRCPLLSSPQPSILPPTCRTSSNRLLLLLLSPPPTYRI